ncbi:restriction endonuclease subunit S [Mesomycoplasma neurolyticum]|uniref:Restriction modification enzyme subunit S2A n=1 Tax=Mesomycoplasma neurolyticum TaxID=2120 RepID=A0A449A4S7_9BACT|nr:restriction endonuclease subunit S [Mesomycoplasma neurolyticum]VEU59261.1 restriction modification enzyme subunit S2A [Mesomycoplasma neurolyticum]
MAIYKLGEISKIVNGSTPSTKRIELWKKEIPFLGPSDIENMKIKRFITKTQKIKRKGTVLISSTATIGNVGILKQESWFNQQITSIEANNDFILDKYLYFYLKKIKNKIILENKNTATIFPIVKINYFKNLIVDIPPLETQNSIIDIIEPLEKVLNNFKNLETNINKFTNKIFKILKNNFYIDNIYEISTGKWNNDVIDEENGIYNFYSCSEHISKSFKSNYNGKYIILSGNGNFYCWWYNGIFDLYQRNYAIKPKKLFFTTFWTIQNFIQQLRNQSNGSVIKYLKLNQIKNIKILDVSLENELEKIYILLNTLILIKNKINKILNLKIKLLVNNEKHLFK